MRTVVIATLLLGALAGPATAAPHHDGRQAHESGGPFKQLGLSPAQLKQIQAIRERHRQAMQADWKALEARHAELGVMLRGPAATLEQAEAKQREIDAIRSRLAHDRIQAWFESRTVLTPEQLAKLQTLQPPARRGGRETW